MFWQDVARAGIACVRLTSHRRIRELIPFTSPCVDSGVGRLPALYDSGFQSSLNGAYR